MRPRHFQYHSPISQSDAFRLFERWPDECMYYAGGTEAMIALKERVIAYEHIINLKQIDGLGEISVKAGKLEIGALVTHQQLADSDLVRTLIPGYARLSDNIANVRVRETGTLAGNLCFGEPHADPPAMLAALGASVRLALPDSIREVPVADFLLGDYAADLEDGEMLQAVSIPLPSRPFRAWYQKFVHLHRPAAGVAAACFDQDGESWRWEIWAGSLTGRPERLDSLCELLAGQPQADDEDMYRAAAVDLMPLDVPDGNYGGGEYRKHLSAVLAGRAVKECRQ